MVQKFRLEQEFRLEQIHYKDRDYGNIEFIYIYTRWRE